MLKQRNKQMTDKAIKAGQVSMVIILFLAVLSNLYEKLELSIRGVEKVIIMINDASAFLSVTCICFCAIAIFRKDKKYSLAILCGVNIILINRLYSNQIWSAIFAKGKELIDKMNVEMAFFGVALGVLCVCFMYKCIKDRVKAKGNKSIEEVFENTNNDKKSELEAKQGLSNVAKQVALPVVYGDKNAELEIYNETETEGMNAADAIIVENIEKNANSENGIRIPSLLRGSLAVAIFVSLYYGGRFLLGRVGVKIPDFIPIPPTILYCLVLLSVTIILYNIIIAILKHVCKQLRQGNNSFRISAIIAVILETVLVLNSDKVDAGKLTNRFVSAIAENWFTSVFAVIMLFLILQIACIIAGHVFFGGSNAEGNELVELMKSRMKKIELKMVKIAFDIIEGCIALFDFVPDFFATIGNILLAYDIVIGDDKDDGDDKGDKDEENKEDSSN